MGTKVGTFKRYISKLKQTIDIIDAKNVQKGDEITHLTWKNADENEILIGQRNGLIKTFDTASQKLKHTKTIPLENEDHLIGLGITDANKLLTALKSGIVSIWNGKNATNLNAGSGLDKMRICSFESSKCATGGRENPLKLWDLNTQKNIFMSKNIPHDELQLRVPIWVSDMTFLSNSEIVTASRYDNICYYDTRAQRRPVTRIQFDDATYSCVSSCYNDKLIAAGGGKGLVQVIDVRKPGKILHKYKGSVGAVKDIACDKNLPFMFTVSLDRRLRIYDINQPRLLEETYLVSSLNCVLIKQFNVKTEKEEVESNEVNVDKVEDTFEQNKDFENGTEDLVYESKDIYDDSEISKANVKRKKDNKFVKNKKVKNKA